MKRLQKKRSRKPGGTGSPQGEDSMEALRRKLSENERTLRTFKKLISPKFLKELQEKEDLYYFNPHLFKSESGQRFSQDSVRDPVFKAVRDCRRRGHQSQVAEIVRTHPDSDFTEANIDPALAKAFRKCIEDPDWVEPADPKQEQLLASAFIAAVKQGNTPRLKELVKLCEIQETTAFNRPKERQSDSRRWHYYVASAALYFLERGLLPDKKSVEKLAYLYRVRDELPLLKVPVNQWNVRWAQKMKELGNLPKPNWRRIFRKLGLSGLPSAPTHPQ